MFGLFEKSQDLSKLTDEQLIHGLWDALDQKKNDEFLLLIEEALKEGRNVDLCSTTPGGKTLLQNACELEAYWAVESLLNAKVDVNGISVNHPSSSLIFAIEKGNVEILQLLLDHPEIQLNFSNTKSKRTALHTVVMKIDEMDSPPEETNPFIRCLDLLLSSIIKMDARDMNDPKSSLIDAKDEDGNTALHLASKSGAEKAMTKLLEKGANLHLRDLKGRTVLHKVAGVALSDLRSADETAKFVNCLQLLLNWGRSDDQNSSKKSADQIDVNAEDEHGFTPLHYAIYMGMEEAEVILLRHGALLDKMACKMIIPATLESLLDNCIRVPDGKEVSSMKFSVNFDYSLLLAPPAKLTAVAESNMAVNQEEATTKSVQLEISTQQDENNKDNNNIIYSECGTLWYLSRSPKHQHLLKHPLVKSFVMLKWHNISTFYWTNVFIYAFYLLFCTTYILLLHSGWDQAVSKANDLWYGLLVLDIIFFVWEFLQFCTVPCLYIRSFENLVDLAMLSFTLVVLLLSGDPDSVRHFSAVTILLAWTEGMILLSRHPKLSIYVTMFTKVSITFLRLLLWYSVLLIGFALSFYLAFGTLEPPAEQALNGTADSDNNGGRSFASLHESFLKFAAMMTGEFEFADLPFDANPLTSRLLFIVFVFLVIFVLINLLNGLAIMDIQAVQSDAETANFKSQVKSIAIMESILLGDPFHIIQGWTPVRLISTYISPITVSSLKSRNRLIQYIFRSAFLFYECLPKKSSMIDYQGKLEDSDGCSCHLRFQLDQDILEIAQQKALHNQRIAELAKTKNSARKTTDTEKLTGEVRQFLELQKENSSKDDPINPKMDKLISEVDELKALVSELVQRLPGGVPVTLSKHQIQAKE